MWICGALFSLVEFYSEQWNYQFRVSPSGISLVSPGPVLVLISLIHSDPIPTLLLTFVLFPLSPL